MDEIEKRRKPNESNEEGLRPSDSNQTPQRKDGSTALGKSGSIARIPKERVLRRNRGTSHISLDNSSRYTERNSTGGEKTNSLIVIDKLASPSTPLAVSSELRKEGLGRK